MIAQLSPWNACTLGSIPLRLSTLRKRVLPLQSHSNMLAGSHGSNVHLCARRPSHVALAEHAEVAVQAYRPRAARKVGASYRALAVASDVNVDQRLRRRDGRGFGSGASKIFICWWRVHRAEAWAGSREPFKETTVFVSTTVSGATAALVAVIYITTGGGGHRGVAVERFAFVAIVVTIQQHSNNSISR